MTRGKLVTAGPDDGQTLNISLMCPEQHLGVRFLSVGTRCAGLQLFQHYNRSFFFKYTEMLISFCFYPAIYWISFPVLIVFTVFEIYTESKFSVFAHYTVFTIRKKNIYLFCRRSNWFSFNYNALTLTTGYNPC